MIKNIRKLFLISLSLIVESSFSQEASLVYCNKLSSDSIREYLNILTSDSLEGRETGTPGQKKACSFIASKYKEWGLLPAGKSFKKKTEQDTSEIFFQKHPISLKNNKGRNLSVNGINFLFGKDFFYDNFYPDSALFISDFTFIGFGSRTVVKDNFELLHKDVNLLLYDEADEDNIVGFESQQRGSLPSSVFIIKDSLTIQDYFIRGYSYPPGNIGYVKKDLADSAGSFFPVIYISHQVAEKFFPDNKFQKTIDKAKRSRKPLIKKINSPVSLGLIKNTNELCGQNVIAYISGEGLVNETVIISAHYDHLGKKDTLIYYGADDNGSGTSAVLELARVFKQAEREGHTPKRNILFLNVSGEEKGLLGSGWYVKHPSMPLDNTIADLNIDMIGRTDSIHDSTGVKKYIYIIGADKMSTELHTINENQNTAGPNLELDYKYNSESDPNRFYRRSDHFNFVKNGIPVIFYFDGKHADYHKPSDTPDKIDVSLLTDRARLVFLTAWELANRKERILIDKRD